MKRLAFEPLLLGRRTTVFARGQRRRGTTYWETEQPNLSFLPLQLCLRIHAPWGKEGGPSSVWICKKKKCQSQLDKDRQRIELPLGGVRVPK